MTARPLTIAIGFLSGALLLLSFHATFLALAYGGSLGLGSSDLPTPLHARFLALWTVFGGAATLTLAAALSHALAAGDLERRLRAAWNGGSDRLWIACGSASALILPVLLRKYVLLGMPVADDESAYRLMAEILAAGRLFADSPAARPFFDNLFLVNDGKLYARFFVGWPALAAPGVWLGVSGFMNAFYAAAAAAPLFLTVRRLAGSSWARAALVVYLASPMLMVGAATELSHTSCFAALAWLVWLCVAGEGTEARHRRHAGVALAFSAAFFIRPLAALAVGLPWLAGWVSALRPMSPGERRRALAAFAAPALALAALFLTVNQVQNGSPFKTSYDAYSDYAGDVSRRTCDFSDPAASLGKTGVALFRFNFALYGWPSSLLFMFFARGHRARRFWWSALLFVAAHFFVPSAGVDAFAPVLYFELALPVLVLTVLGLRRVHGFFERAAGRGLGYPGSRRLAPSLLIALTAAALAGYAPVRLSEARRLAAAVRMPSEALAEAGIERAVIFAPTPFVSNCRSRPSTPLVHTRPDNDPFLENAVLWVNHRSPEEDRVLMESFPDRRGYLMEWRGCEVAFTPLDRPPGSVAPEG